MADALAVGKRFLASDFDSKIPPLISEETDPLALPRRKPKTEKLIPDIPPLPDPDKIPRPKIPKRPTIPFGWLILAAIVYSESRSRR